ncbi:hypothetical protein [Clostridium tarantellae]|uniref:Uncharacterized protein n=1 Tax=Clostridium tarantellae TaxID=39493 RepID=A0A6I1MS97_9CLOT|nr:hypothetical protein [Clostridium tarantellae]MPQ43139.1 hypothetical protein [Clostridium tarantellae]
MSNSKVTKHFFKKEEKFKKNSQLNKDILISYKEKKNIMHDKTEDFYEVMKRGYEEMGEINLLYAEEAMDLALNDQLEYEMWLGGV